jgi:predicted nuclease of restriction endonuclease-like (RecB) superfamily
MDLNQQTEGLLADITHLIDTSKQRIAIAVNTELPILYWHIGKHTQTFILHGERAAYGQKIIVSLSKQLIIKYGKGWSSQHLRHCLRIAETFEESEIIYALRRQLSWTHLRTISYEHEPTKRTFYLKMAAECRWSTRDLGEQIDKMLFERTALAQKPEEQISKALENWDGEEPLNPDLVFKNSYVLDFLGLQNVYSEKELEDALITHLQQFIQELGNGFAFLERQKRISIDAVDYYLDLLFYHRKLKRLVAIDLKLGKFKPKYKAQMELYLRWLERYEMETGEQKPIGLLLCSEGNTEHIELLMLDETDIKVAQYLTELPTKEWFIEKLHRAIEIAKMNQDNQNLEE